MNQKLGRPSEWQEKFDEKSIKLFDISFKDMREVFYMELVSYE
jgi:hypothetical protein